MPQWFKVLLFCVGVWGIGAVARGEGTVVEVKTVLLKVIEEVEVPAREEGQIKSIPVQAGDLVKSGQLLAQIDDDEVRLQQEQAQLDFEMAAIKAADDTAVKLAEEQLRVALEDLNRNRASKARFDNSVSQSEMEQMELKVATAKHALAQAKQELTVADLKSRLSQKTVAFAELKLQRHQVKSPLEGMVVEIFRQPGDWMKPGDKLARVIRVDRLRAEGFVDLKDASPGLVGRTVSVVIETPGRTVQTYPGQVVFLSPEVDMANRQTRVWAEIPANGRRLEPGLRGKMLIHLDP